MNIEAQAARLRILRDDDPVQQAALEQIAVLHSIRAILMWTLVVVPLFLAALAGVVLAVMSR
jgi:hypothetical protein